ncbi:hypothetical protein D3C81_2001330 [compost metagenome]
MRPLGLPFIAALAGLLGAADLCRRLAFNKLAAGVHLLPTAVVVLIDIAIAPGVDVIGAVNHATMCHLAGFLVVMHVT